MTFIYISLTIIAAGIFAELVGYIIHVLLHSNRIQFLSRNHMIHHLKHYGPKMHQRSDAYVVSTDGRASVGNVGLEWLVPIGLVAALVIGAFQVLHFGFFYLAIFMSVSTAWSLAMFNYMHDTLHIKNIWLEKSPRLTKWFLEARRLHDIHHMDLTDDGRMTKNYGICFFWFDRLFGSLSQRFKGFNKSGFEEAQKRYSFIYDDKRI